MSDKQRIEFLENRDTEEQVIYFAKQTTKQYRNALLSAKRKYGKNHTYRKQLIQSYIFHKNYKYPTGET